MSPLGDASLRVRAADPTATAVELNTIAETESSGLLRLVASNPACPLELLAKLALVAPREVASNSVLQLLALSEGVALVHRFPPIALEAMLRVEEGAWLLPLVLSSERDTTRATAKVVPDLPAPFYKALLMDPSPIVRAAVVERLDLPEDARRRLARDRAPLVQGKLALKIDLAPELLLYLARHGSRSVRAAVANNSSTPPEVLRWLVLHGSVEQVHGSAAKNRALPVEVLSEMAVHKGTTRRALAAEAPRLPEDLLAALAVDPKIHVRCAAAGNPKTPRASLEKLAKDPSDKVRRRVAGNHACSPEMLVCLLADKAEEVGDFAASNPNLPVKSMEALIAQKRRLLAVALNPSLPPRLAATLAEHHPASWHNLGRNSLVSPEILASLVDRMQYQFLSGLAQNPSLPVEAMEKLARMPPGASGTSPALYLLRNPSLPRWLLEGLTRSPDGWVAVHARRKLRELDAREVACSRLCKRQVR